MTQNNRMQIKLNVDFQVALGPLKNEVTRVGEEMAPNISDKKGYRGSGVHTNSDITNKSMHKFNMLLMNSCIFLVFKYTLGRRLGTGWFYRSLNMLLLAQ